MKKIILRVSNIYGFYKQIPYIFLMILFMALAVFFTRFSSILILIACIFLIRAIYGIIYYRLIQIELFPDRLNVKKGVFTHNKSFLELYRVKDFGEKQSFFMRIFGLMTVTLETSDKSDPFLNLVGIPKSDIVEVIRGYVETQRKLKGVREFD